jgi:hypothetical protein
VAKAQIVACGYTGLKVCAGGVQARAYRNSKCTHLGTFGDVHAAARACNEFSGAQPGGGSNYNAVEQQMDAEGAPTERSCCA